MESYKKGIVWSSLLNVISKLIGFSANLVIAYYFGTQIETDIYFYCIATITLISSYITSLNSSIIIPESMRIFSQEGKKSSIEFVNYFIIIYLVIGVTVTICLLIQPVQILFLISNFKKEELELYSGIVKTIVPMLFLVVINTFLMEILYSYKFFTIPTITRIISSVLNLLFLVIFHNKLGILSLALGLGVAQLIQLGMVLFLLKKSLNWRFTFKKIALGKKNINNIFYALCGNITSVLSGYIPLYMLSGFSAGALTALNYSQRLTNLPHMVVTQQFSSVTAIKYNELFAQKKWKELNEIFLKTSKILIFILMPISCVVYLLSLDIINVLFKRGAFDSDSVQRTSDFLKYLILTLPLLSINTLISRVFMAGQKLKQSFWYQIIFNLVLVALVFFFVKEFGEIGYPISLVVMHCTNMIACYFLLKIFIPFINFSSVLFYFIKIILTNCFIMAVIFFGLTFVNSDSLIRVIAGSTMYLLLLVGLNYLLNLNSDINHILSKKYGKNKVC